PSPLRVRGPRAPEVRMSQPPPPATTEAAKKTAFDKVLTATPVILTIVATFLIGQSSSEMTQAQYHRATASQNQSKVADQWAFFQAKRIRGTSYELTAELLSALRETEAFERDTLPVAAQALAAERSAAQSTAQSLAATLGKDKAPAAEKVTQQASQIKELAGQSAQTAADVRAACSGAAGRNVTGNAMATALAALASPDAHSPDAKGPGGTSGAGEHTAEAAKIQAAVDAIRKRRPDKEIDALVFGITDAGLHDAIAAAERSADAVYQRGKEAETALEKIDKLVDAEIAIARRFLKAVAAIADELA